MICRLISLSQYPQEHVGPWPVLDTEVPKDTPLEYSPSLLPLTSATLYLFFLFSNHDFFSLHLYQ